MEPVLHPRVSLCGTPHTFVSFLLQSNITVLRTLVGVGDQIVGLSFPVLVVCPFPKIFR